MLILKILLTIPVILSILFLLTWNAGEGGKQSLKRLRPRLRKDKGEKAHIQAQ